MDSTYGQALTTLNFHIQPSAKEMAKSERAISLQKDLRKVLVPKKQLSTIYFPEMKIIKLIEIVQMQS